MKAAFVMAAIISAILPSASLANPQENAVKAVVRAVTDGEDLNAAFPGAISEKEIAALRGVSTCTADNLKRQAKGRYTVVWFCGKKAALGMEVLVADDRVTSISTMEILRRRVIQ